MSKRLILDASEIKRVKTYIKGLDENMQGGVPEGHVTLIHGAPGTMKSSLSFSILFNEAILNKKTGLYISLEQGYESLVKNMINLGFNLNNVNLVYIDDLTKFNVLLKNVKPDQGNIILADLGCIRKQIKDVKTDENRSWLNVIKNLILKTKNQVGIDLLTFDSLSALYTLSMFKNPRMELFYLFEYLRDLEVTSYLISEEYIYNGMYMFEIEAFLSDGIITLRLTPFRRNIVREIKIDKMRATKCNNDVFSFEYKNGSFYALYGGQNPLL